MLVVMSHKVVVYSSASGGTMVNKYTLAMVNLVKNVGCNTVQVVYLDATPADKEMVWSKSGKKGVYPLLFVDDEFVGDHDTVLNLNEDGLLRGKLGV